MENQIVYVVMKGCYSDRGIEGIFSTREKAEAYKVKFDTHDRYQKAYINEWTLDELQDIDQRPVYTVTLKADGSLDRQDTCTDMVRPNYTHNGAYTNGSAYGSSTVSFEHALKLAAEARQAFLRSEPPDPCGY